MRVRSNSPLHTRPPVHPETGPSRLAQQSRVVERVRLVKAAGGSTDEETQTPKAAKVQPSEPDTDVLLAKDKDMDKPASNTISWQLLVGMVTASVVICYADRSNISTAILPMADQYGWDKGLEGTILSAFFGGYLATQLLGGQLADKYGGRMVLTFGVSAWSVFTFLTPWAAAGGTGLMIASRVAMGLGEGVAFPAIHALIAKGVPVERQSTAVGIVTAASYLGTALAFGVAPIIIDQLGWPWAFYLFGAAACLWLPVWIPMHPPVLASPKLVSSRSDPELGTTPYAPLELTESGSLATIVSQTLDTKEQQQQAKHRQPSRTTDELSAQEAAELQNGIESDTAAMLAGNESSESAASTRVAADVEVGLRALLKTRPVWAICIAQYTGSWGLYGLLNWLPTFFKEQYQVEIADLGSYTLLPYVVQAGTGAAAGVIADRLIERGWQKRRVRRMLQTIGMLGPAACLLVSVSPITDTSASLASAWITLGLGFSAFTLGAVSTSHLDVAPKHAGAVFGAGNMAATTAGLLAVPVTGFILEQTGSWTLVFGVTAMHYAVGALMYYLWVGTEPLPQDG